MKRLVILDNSESFKVGDNDTLINSGIWTIQGNSFTNGPVNSVWGVLISINIGAVWNGIQILVDTNANKVYWRTWNSTNIFSTWSAWN